MTNRCPRLANRLNPSASLSTPLSFTPWPMGHPGTTEPLLCVVVLSYDNHDTVLSAVNSLLEQDEPIEVVVSHSGGGPTRGPLAPECPQVRVVASERRRSCSEARNAGIQATRAPYVAFLEADCLAEPGWIAGRLR